MRIALALCAAPGVLASQAHPSAAKPATPLGFAPDRLARIDRLLQQAVDSLVGVFMIQQMPNSSDVAGKFPTLVYQALVDPKP